MNRIPLRQLDLMTTSELVSLFICEEEKAIKLLKKQKSKIIKVINSIRKHIQRDSRIIYIGAGTSGRIGVLDASECKPTFGTNLFLSLIAGGKSAVFSAKEGREDDTKQAVKDLQEINLNKKDIVVGLSASGETPYTVSGIKYAKKHKALTVGITSSPDSTLSKITNCSISPDIKDEIILGSSRLKSGTVQKIILNMISSIVMIKAHKVFNNLMIDVQPSNEKLIKRATGIISNICKVSLNKAKKLFLRAKKNTKAAIIMHFKKCNLQSAKVLLEKTGYNLRKIIR